MGSRQVRRQKTPAGNHKGRARFPKGSITWTASVSLEYNQLVRRARRPPTSERVPSGAGSEPERLEGRELLLAVLTRRVSDPAEVNIVCRRLGLPPRAHYGVAIMQRADNTEGLGQGGAAFADALATAFRGKQGLSTRRFVSGERCVMVVYGDELGARGFESAVESAMRQGYRSADRPQGSWVAAGSAVHPGWEGLILAYEEALRALAYRPDRGGGGVAIVWNRLLEPPPAWPLYPLDTERRLLAATEAGSHGRVREVLAELISDNFDSPVLSAYQTRVLLHDLEATVLRALSGLPVAAAEQAAEIEVRLARLPGTDHPREHIRALEWAFQRLCEVFDRQKRSHNRSLLDQIHEYIDASHRRPDLCVGQVAQQLGVSASYLSQFFKEQTGQRLSRFIEEVRIRAAGQLMGERGLTVGEIAERSGFGSQVTFRRAFARVNGLTPSEYRRGRRVLSYDWSMPRGSTRELVLAHSDPPEGQRQKSAVLFAERVSEYTSGRRAVRSYPDSILGNETKLLNLTASGAIDFVVAGSSMYARHLRQMSVLMSPFLVHSLDEGWHLYADSFYSRVWYTALESSGFRILTALERGFRCLTTREPVSGPADLRGLRIRVPPNPINDIMWRNIGATPVSMPIDKVHEALEKGLIDGQENPISTIWAHRFHEVAPYITLTRHIYAPVLLSVGVKSWERIGSADRESILRAAGEVGLESRRQLKEQERITLSQMRKSGAVVSEPSPSEWIAAMTGVADEFRERFGADLDIE